MVLAAGRGSADPLAAHFGVSHKCLLPVGGTAMLQRVVAALRDHSMIGDVIVSIEEYSLLAQALGKLAKDVIFASSQSSAAKSAGSAVRHSAKSFPVLLTTADHALLDREMLDHFIAGSASAQCDLTVGLATAQTILSA